MAFQPCQGRRAKPQKPRLAFVWPKDGKRTTTMGRLADIMQNRGPDIHVMTHRGQRGNLSLGWDAPRRGQWSRWAELDDNPENELAGNFCRVAPPMPWARRGPAKKYDFRTRKWVNLRNDLWSDVEWEAGARTNDQIPRRWRDADGYWWRVEQRRIDVGGPCADDFA